MDNSILYKALWVEDEPGNVESLQMMADEQGIELDQCPNWEEAERRLMVSFNEYTAIILDAFCPLSNSEKVANESFLGHVMIRLSRIFGEKHKFIPWYVLSAKTMSNFNVVIQLINTYEREQLKPEWGKLVYSKTNDTEVKELFDNICRVGPNMTVNTVLCRHFDVFKYVGDGLIINSVNARNILLKMLSALYNPEENLNFEYEGNPLRKVLEYLFRSAKSYGLLPDECFKHEGNNVVLQESSKYMAGQTAVIYSDSNTVEGQIRYGIPNESIFTKDIASVIQNMLNFTSADSHTKADEPYCISTEKKDLFFGYVLQLCHVIRFYGQFVETHSNVDINKQKQTRLNCQQYEGQEGVIEYDEHVNLLHVGDCMVTGNANILVGRKVKLKSVTTNSNASVFDIYPYFAKYDKVN